MKYISRKGLDNIVFAVHQAYTDNRRMVELLTIPMLALLDDFDELRRHPRKAEVTNHENLIHIEPIKLCIYSGDPDCFGWPEVCGAGCIYEECECQFCECGGHDVYGEMYHNEGCALWKSQQKQ
jgi:hypothetical protein